MPVRPPGRVSPEASGPARADGGPLDGTPPAAGHWPAFDRADLERARAGDPEALGRFFDHYFERVFSLVHRFVGRFDEAQDITQDTFLKVRRHIGRLDIDSDPAPWLYTVAINTCRDYRRSGWWRVSRKSVPLDSAAPEPALPSNAPGPEQALEAAEEERRLEAAIGRLPPDLRASVILHDFEGLPHDRIAAIAGISHVAARKRYSRGLRVLADLLSAEAGP